MKAKVLEMVTAQIARGRHVGVLVRDVQEARAQYQEMYACSSMSIESGSLADMSIRFHSGGRMDFWCSTSDQAGRGRKYDMVLVDEETLKTPVCEYAIKPALYDSQGVCVLS